MTPLPRVILLVSLTVFVAACSDDGRTGFTGTPSTIANIDDEQAMSAGGARKASAGGAVDTSYVPQVPYYKNVAWTPGDGSTPQGGIPPAAAKEPRAIPSEFDTGPWTLENSPPGSSAGGEAKFRTHCNYSHLAYDDPVVYPAQPNVSHLHMFFGNMLTNAFSTYQSLRSAGGSTCGGGPINRSAYWFPAVLKDNATGDGKTKAIKADHMVVYYNVADYRTKETTRLLKGMSYVFGFSPSDPTNEAEKAEIAASKAKAYAEDPGGLHSYAFLTNGFLGWKCGISNGSTSNSPLPGSFYQPYLRNANGTAAISCPATEGIGVMLLGPPCWDGQNLTSPNGRGHVRQFIKEINTGRQDICPEGWYGVPRFELVIWFSHKGEDDYKEWYLSSDRMPGMTQFLNGQSMHTDWFGAWDYRIMKRWMVHCNGVTIGNRVGDPHSCTDTQFGDGTKGKAGVPAPDGSRIPQVDTGIRWADHGDEHYLDLPEKPADAQMHLHHKTPAPAPGMTAINPPDEIDENSRSEF